ncbi:hypothetical protein IFT84_20545 [Rhizobium sp. CFBP 8762]|uniref:hypothetical protein n=1 Tax=Rhizobium sp. CFBP 8762 TaxID=2775279 RepID=UPI001784F765|nr:hypothetical protein [Rhizobium sp. CFBP 8762]MBD8556902.1 hypothetical protein [Rhizobium sp. CFBP 8762]
MTLKTMRVASPRGIIIPGTVLGLPKDYSTDPHEAVDVPEDYGRMLVENRFAHEVIQSEDAGSADKPNGPEKPKGKGRGKASVPPSSPAAPETKENTPQGQDNPAADVSNAHVDPQQSGLPLDGTTTLEQEPDPSNDEGADEGEDDTSSSDA